MANKTGKIASISSAKGSRSPQTSAFLNKDGVILEFGGFDPEMIGQANLRLSASGTLGKILGLSGQVDMVFSETGQIYLTKYLVGETAMDIILTGRLRKLFRQNKYTPIYRLISIASNNKIYYEVV